MSYWLLRVRIYHEELRQWLQSLQQIGFGLIVLFPMALPALVFLPLLSLGVAANPATSALVYLNTLWGYLLLLYSWMILQREGINGSRYQLYLQSLPTPPLFKKVSDLGLLIYGAHFFILGPLLLLSVVLFQQSARLTAAGSMQLWLEFLPLAGMLLLAICYSLLALRRKIPWLSLLVFPFLAFSWAPEVSKPQWLLLWGAVLVVEYWLPVISLKLGNWPQGLYRLLLSADLHSPSAECLRLVALLLLIALTRVCVAAVNADFALYLLNLISFLSALLLASSLFGTQALRAQYQLYLATLPQGASQQAVQSLCYVLAKTLVGVLLMVVAGIFDLTQWLLWLLFYIATLLGIWLKPALFLMFPFALMMVLVVLRAVDIV